MAPRFNEQHDKLPSLPMGGIQPTKETLQGRVDYHRQFYFDENPSESMTFHKYVKAVKDTFITLKASKDILPNETRIQLAGLMMNMLNHHVIVSFANKGMPDDQLGTMDELATSLSAILHEDDEIPEVRSKVQAGLIQYMSACKELEIASGFSTTRPRTDTLVRPPHG